jgi:hypothetical protein
LGVFEEFEAALLLASTVFSGTAFFSEQIKGFDRIYGSPWGGSMIIAAQMQQGGSKKAIFCLIGWNIPETHPPNIMQISHQSFPALQPPGYASCTCRFFSESGEEPWATVFRIVW